MKKTFTLSKILLIIMLTLAFSFTSCKGNKEDEGRKRQATNCDFKVNFWFDDNVLDIFDVMINFTEHDGNVVSEVVTRENTVKGISSSNEDMIEVGAPASSELNHFSKEFNDKTFPTSLSYQVVYTLKDNPKESCFYLEDKVLKCDLAYYNEHQCTNDLGVRLADFMYSRMLIGLEKENIGKWLEIQSKVYYKVQVDSDGYLVTDKE